MRRGRLALRQKAPGAGHSSAGEGIVPACEFLLDLVHAPRAEVVGVDADIEAIAVGLVIEAAVNMAEEMPAAVPRAVPLAHGIMAHDHAPSPFMNLANVADACKQRGVMRERFVIVVARDEMDVSVQLAQIGVGAAPVPKTEIAEVIDGIVRPDALVPSADKSLVHLRDVCEGPSAGLDNIFMSEMGIRQKECRHARPVLDDRTTA